VVRFRSGAQPNEENPVTLPLEIVRVIKVGQAVASYAWSSPVESAERRRFFAMLHLGSIRSLLSAVRVAIMAEHRVAR
jgi:hypothetical protein